MLSACVFGFVIPPESKTTELRLLETAVNHSHAGFRLLDIDRTVGPGEAFMPTNHADVAQPPTLEQARKLNVTHLASISAGMPIRLIKRNPSNSLYAYLVVYPVYNIDHAPRQYQINITNTQLNRARKGETVRTYGHYDEQGHKWVSWAMWLSNKSLDVDCGCS